MVLIVLRHGQSIYNKENRFTGLTDVSLSEIGRSEALDAGLLLKKYNFDCIFTSDLKRTDETANIIRYNSNNALIINMKSNKALNERDYGELTGKNKTELKEMYGEKVVHIWRRSYLERPPGGECLHDVRLRVADYFDNEIKNKVLNGKNVLIVAHGNSLRALFVHLGIKDETSIETFEIATGVPIQIDLCNHKFWYENSYKLNAYQILDSRGFPTIEVQCIDIATDKCVGVGAVPSGSSCGSGEAIELRDGDMKVYCGKGVLGAISHINELNKTLILNYNTVTNLKNIDSQMIALDSSNDKHIIGGNVTTAVSLCMMNVGANILGLEMFEYIRKIYGFTESTSPTIMANIINGGKHGQGGLKIQEFMIVPKLHIDVRKRVQMICEVYHMLKKLLLKKYGSASTNIGDEGGYVVCGMKKTNEALDIIEEAMVACGYVPGIDIFIALDCASTEFYNEEVQKYEIEKGMFLTSDELIEYYGYLIEKYPSLQSIEDGFHEYDYEGWAKFVSLYGKKIMIVGDDLLCTNPKLIKRGIDAGWMNALLLKVNQIGTVTEAIDGARKMFDKGLNVIVSHRSGEVNNSYIVDLAVGIGAKYLKIGAPARGERVSKYNRVLSVLFLEKKDTIKKTNLV